MTNKQKKRALSESLTDSTNQRISKNIIYIYIFLNDKYYKEYYVPTKNINIYYIKNIFLKTIIHLLNAFSSQLHVI